MRLNYLKAENYRNIAFADIGFSNGVNLLYGKNGAGKTNVLEAVYLFALCKSFRTNKENDFIMHGKDSASISIGFSSDYKKSEAAPSEMALHFRRSEKKRMAYEGVTISKVSEFAGRFRAVFFTPDHLSLIKGSPEERRKFADMALAQIKPGYIRLLNEYTRVLSQRNIILKNAKINGSFDAELLSVYSEALAEAASVITKQRAYFCEYLEKEAAKFYKIISGSEENLFIRYFSSEKEAPKDSAAVKKRYFSLYSDNINGEVKSGSTKYGPHKDDILFFIGKNGEKNNENELFQLQNEAEKAEEEKRKYEEIRNFEKNSVSEFAARTFASQGQQRSAVLSLKLAEGEIIRTLCGEYPVYLFDDVLSELDSERKKQLLSLFEDKQVIITCCDENAFDKKQIEKKIKVCDGSYN